jgi:N5-(carboxyethyl)ornithine synthase
MKKIGFLIPHEYEKRRALFPYTLSKVKYPDHIYFEKGYGKILGYSDEDYLKYGGNICRRENIFKLDIISDFRFPLKEKNNFRKGQIFFGWVHAVQQKEIREAIIRKKLTAIAWEEMYNNKGKHIFWKNNEIAGTAAVLHALSFYGKSPFNLNVAVIGKGNCARGALRILRKLNANIKIYNRKNFYFLRKELGEFNVIVNAVKWDFKSKEKLIYKEDLKNMKKGSMIIDITCNKNLEIETSYPRTIKNPIYHVNGVIHYAVENIASLLWIDASRAISRSLIPYINILIEEKFNEVIEKATIIKDGNIRIELGILS